LFFALKKYTFAPAFEKGLLLVVRCWILNA
jgi:hypothetical protein